MIALFSLGGTVLWVLLLAPALVLHELFHVLAATVCGYQLAAVTLGPLQLRRRAGRWRVRRAGFLAGGLAHIEVSVRQERRQPWRLVGYAALPPLLTLLTGGGLLAWASAHRGPIAGPVSCAGLAALLVGAGTLFPWLLNLRRSDGQYLLHFLSGEREWRRELAIFCLNFGTPVCRPRDWDSELVRLASTPGGRYLQQEGCFLAYYRALDLGDLAAAEAQLDQVEASSVRLLPVIAFNLRLERAYLAACRHADTAAAMPYIAGARGQTLRSQAWFRALLGERSGYGMRTATAVMAANGRLTTEQAQAERTLTERHGPTFTTDDAAGFTAQEIERLDAILQAALAVHDERMPLPDRSIATRYMRERSDSDVQAPPDGQHGISSPYGATNAASMRAVAASLPPWQTVRRTRIGGWVTIIWGAVVFRLDLGGWAVTRAHSARPPDLPVDSIQRAHLLLGVSVACGLAAALLAAWILYLRLGRGAVRLLLAIVVVMAVASSAGHSIVGPAGIGVPGIGWFHGLVFLLSMWLFAQAWDGPSRVRLTMLRPPPLTLERLLIAGGTPLLVATLLFAQTRAQFSSYFEAGQADAANTAPAVSVGNGPLLATYVFDDGVTDAQRQAVRDGAALADRYFRVTFGAGVQRAVVIDVRSVRPRPAHDSGAEDTHTITLYTIDGAGGSYDTVRLQEGAVHELFHVLESELSQGRAFAQSPDWLLEGAAELVAQRALIAGGALALDVSRGCLLQELQPERHIPPLQALAAVRSIDASRGDLNALATLATASLTGESGTAYLRSYFEALFRMDWTAAFESAFGVSSGDFYRRFAAERAALVSTGQAGCTFYND